MTGQVGPQYIPAITQLSPSPVILTPLLFHALLDSNILPLNVIPSFFSFFFLIFGQAAQHMGS